MKIRGMVFNTGRIFLVLCSDRSSCMRVVPVQTRFCPTEDIVGKGLLTFTPICHCSLIRVVLALVPSGCALLAWIITTTMKFDAPTPSKPLPSLVPDSLSSLQEPLLHTPPVEQDSTTTMRLRGGNSSTPCSIRDRGMSAENHGIIDVEAPSCEIESDEAGVQTQDEEQHTLWQMLGHVMVGRWGSIRPSRLPFLQYPPEAHSKPSFSLTK
jgi:hypothetical protein